MSSIDYDLLRGEAGGEPPAGLYDAYLMRAALVTTDKGTSLVAEWQTLSGTGYYWTAWFGFTPQRMQFTQEFLDGVGIDRHTLTDDERFEQELSQIQGSVYQVRVESKNGYLNTFVLDSAQVQQQLSDIPADVSDLPSSAPPPGPAPTPVGAGVGAQQALPADDDIPF